MLSGESSDKMVRIPKEMYDGIMEIISMYPEYGWKGPAEFVRDAVRRYLEEIKNREKLYRKLAPRLPGRIIAILREVAGEKLAMRIERELEKIEFEDPKLYYTQVLMVLSKYVGKGAAQLLAKRIMEIMMEELKYEEESENRNTRI